MKEVPSQEDSLEREMKRLGLTESSFQAFYDKKDAFVRQYIKSLESNPLIVNHVRHVNYCRRNHVNPRLLIQTPDQVMVERKLTVAGVLMGTTQPESTPEYERMSEDHRSLVRFSIAGSIENAQVFLWRTRIIDSIQGLQVPDHVFGKEGWPYPLMWWTFEDCPLLTSLEGERLNVGTVLLVQKEGEGVHVYTFYAFDDKTLMPPNVDMFIKPRLLPYGEKIGRETLHGKEAWLAFIVKAVSFLNSKYVDHSPQRLSRTGRKLLDRAGKKADAMQQVHVVDLRAKETLGKKSEREGKRDWSGRWWVRGHIRAQWCPGSKSHKLIWIAPYIKGPEDKPLNQKMYRVVR